MVSTSATTPSIGVTMISTSANIASTNANIASTNVNMASADVNIRESDEFRIMQAVCQKIGGTGPFDFLFCVQLLEFAINA